MNRFRGTQQVLAESTRWARYLGAAALLSVGTPALVPAEGIGWRTDGSGCYPKAQPPLRWSTTESVAWCTPMPGYGVSQPVLLGERLFICAEPGTLLCLDRTSGKILWQKTSSYSEVQIEPAVRAQLEVELREVARLSKKQSAVHKEMDELHRALKKEWLTNKEVDQKLKPYRKQIDDLQKEKKKLAVAERYTQPGTHPYAGYSAPTPVTDGKDVFVVLGNGLVACYDLEGERKWLKLVEHSNLSFAHSGSPILVGGKLVVHFTDLVALNMKTGDELWRLKQPSGHGTPLVTRVGKDDVILTPKGAMVRAEDGKLLARGLGSCGSNSPVLHEGIVYYVAGEARAIRLPESVDEPVKPEVVWKGRVKGGGYWFSSPVVYDGLLYAANDQGILSVLDAGTGEVVYEDRLNLGGSTYPSISQAGPYVFVSSDTGTTVVLQPGRKFKVLARNKLETFRSSLVFEGRRLYVRTAKNLFCIGE